MEPGDDGLRPCPFCKRVPSIYYQEKSRRYRVECEWTFECRGQKQRVYARSEERVIEKWNHHVEVKARRYELGEERFWKRQRRYEWRKVR